MKPSNYLLFLAIYGGITAFMMLFNPSGSLKDYGVPADAYHVVIFQYLGISNLTMAAVLFFLRNKVSTQVIRILLIISAIEMLSSSLKGFYDVQMSGIPGNTFFWADAIIRAFVGLVTVYIYFTISKKTV